MHTVNFYVMRHGKKGGDRLTEEGFQMVQRSAQMHLSGIPIHAALYSGMNRTLQTVNHALNVAGAADVPVEIDYGFGYSWAIGDPNCSVYKRAEYRFDPLPNDQSVLKTVGDCLKYWPPSRIYRHRIRGALLSQAEAMSFRFPDNDTVNVLVGSHSPTAEMAAGYDFPRLQEADIVLYVINIFDNVEPGFVDAHYLACPPKIARLDGSTRLGDGSVLG